MIPFTLSGWPDADPIGGMVEGETLWSERPKDLSLHLLFTLGHQLTECISLFVIVVCFCKGHTKNQLCAWYFPSTFLWSIQPLELCLFKILQSLHIDTYYKSGYILYVCVDWWISFDYRTLIWEGFFPSLYIFLFPKDIPIPMGMDLSSIKVLIPRNST